jgi:23S rRNA pseudouridine1911/1915/1917 synthase
LNQADRYHWTVREHDAGTRLDKFLAAPDRLGSRGRAVAALERAKVLVNDADVGVADAARRLAAGEVVRVWMDRPGSATRRLGPIAIGDLRILHEDDLLLVVDKPAGMLAVPLPRKPDAPSVFDLLADHFRSHRRLRPLVVHRIDRDTSGLVVFAKQPDAQEQLKEQFARREPERLYRAIVYGRLEPARGTWRDRLAWDRDELIQRHARASDPRAKEAVCSYRVMETFRDASLIEVRLQTGRRNQIRIQAALRGHPLVGERRYVSDVRHVSDLRDVSGPVRSRPIPFSRQALHAYRLSFRHPRDGRLLTFESPMPSDLTELLARLRRS